VSPDLAGKLEAVGMSIDVALRRIACAGFIGHRLKVSFRWQKNIAKPSKSLQKGSH
jgi:hypothetical protein